MLREQFSAWLQEQVATAPESPAALLVWWVSFKASLRQRSFLSHRQAMEARNEASQQLLIAKQALDTAITSLESGSVDPQLLGQVVEARTSYTRVLMEVPQAHDHFVTTTPWIHQHERPSPVMTQLLRPPTPTRYIPSLRHVEGGALVHDPVHLTNFVIGHYASVSSPPLLDEGAQSQILEAVLASGVSVPVEAATVLGSSVILPSECDTVLSRAKPGKTPGPDGIPTELYRFFKEIFAPLLSKVFTAMITCNALPRGFLNGIISPLPKPGDQSFISNLRPITLLNCDYRILARILANRLGPILDSILPPEHTAFLKGRSIGDTIIALQLLPTYLRKHGQAAVVAFLDFMKAYDTISRPFLFAIMRAMGVGDGFLLWISLLLSDTKAAALVNGHLSSLQYFGAGVRQGCPLAPLLYLFIAFALSAWLKHRQIGIQIGSRFTSSLHFADDTEVFLRSLAPAVVQAFLDAMDIFRKASGQQLNASKSMLLPIGDLTKHCDPLPEQVGRIPVVQFAKALGILFSNSDEYIPHQNTDIRWTKGLKFLTTAYTKIPKMGLSTFGRAFATSGYGISTLLFQAEYTGLPDEIMEKVVTATTKVVDRRMGPMSSRRHGRFVLPGIPSMLLSGAPRDGGFGSLPLRAHLLARHAVWGCKLLCALTLGVSNTTPLWTFLAQELLRPSTTGSPTDPLIHPMLRFLACDPPIPPGPLARFAAGLRAVSSAAMAHIALNLGVPPPSIPYPVVVRERDCPLVDTLEAVAFPLWNNPCLPSVHLGPERLPILGSTLDTEHSILRLIPSLGTLGDFHRIWGALATARGFPDPDVRTTHLLKFWTQEFNLAGLSELARIAEPLAGFIRDWEPLFQRLATLRRALHVSIPHDILYPSAPPPDPPVTRVLPTFPLSVLERLGWALPLPSPHPTRRPSPPPTLHALTVRQGTQILMGPTAQHRQQAHLAYIAAAMAPSPPHKDGITRLHFCLRKAWSLKWDNNHKDIFWRLTVDGICGCSARSTWGCPCCPFQAPAFPSREYDPRIHAYWECPVAQAVIHTIEVELHLGRIPPWPARRGNHFQATTLRQGAGHFHVGQAQPPLLMRSSLWLCSSPSRFVHSGVWMVVCLAALSAMDYGRRQLFRLLQLSKGKLNAGSAPPIARQCTLHEAWGLTPPPPRLPPPPSLVGRVRALVVADFWGRLSQYAAMGLAPASWECRVGPTHPFLTHGGKRLSVLQVPRLTPPVVLPPPIPCLDPNEIPLD